MTDSKDVKGETVAKGTGEKPWEKEECQEPPPQPAAFGAKDLGMTFITEAPEPPPRPAGPPMEPGEKHNLGLVGTDSKEDEELRKKMPTATPEEIAAYKEAQAKQKKGSGAVAGRPPEAAKPKPNAA